MLGSVTYHPGLCVTYHSGSYHHVAVSRRIRDEFSNGRQYYALEGKALQITPQSAADRPSKEFLEWHQNNCFRLQ
jgi:putative restriction endonuclease